MECYRMDWMEAEHLIDKVVKKIWIDGFAPDVIVGISRGGLIPARMIADRMALKEVITIKMEHWGTAVPLEEARITRGLHGDIDLKGKNVLLVDDLTDTGESLQKAKKHVESYQPAEVKTAVIEHKLCSKYLPDYYARKLQGWKWIIYPWDLHEDMIRFVGEVIGEGKTMAEIREALRMDYSLYLSNHRLNGILKDMTYKGLVESQERDGKEYWIKKG